MNLVNAVSTTHNNNKNELVSLTFNIMPNKLNQIEFKNNNNEQEIKHNENVWILRDDYSINNIATHNPPTKVPTSCLKAKSNNRKTNKFVHYAPLISQGKFFLKYILKIKARINKKKIIQKR
jgi:hypothetical protein